MPENEIHKAKRSKNMVTFGLVLGWCLLIFLVTIVKLANAQDEVPDPFIDDRTSHQAEIEATAEQWQRRDGPMTSLRHLSEEDPDVFGNAAPPLLPLGDFSHGGDPSEAEPLEIEKTPGEHIPTAFEKMLQEKGILPADEEADPASEEAPVAARPPSPEPERELTEEEAAAEATSMEIEWPEDLDEGQ